MCDLIDLNSPDTRKLIISKLASPLIPIPPGSGNDGPCTPIAGTHLMRGENRTSLDNNPFDKVLKETSEYIQKRGDPFEVVLEKALKTKGQSGTPKARSVEFNDDFTPKRTRPYQVLKMNKTLDESLMEGELYPSIGREVALSTPGADQSIIQDLNNTNLLGESRRMSEGNRSVLQDRSNSGMPCINVEPPSPGSLSILNQSAMDDTLFEVSGSSEENEIKALIAQRISICVHNGTLKGGDHPKSNKHLQRRSLSQGDKKSPKTPKKVTMQFRPRSRSIIDTLKENFPKETKTSVSSISSAISNDMMNKGFLTGGSVSSGISDVSSIHATSRLNSASSILNSSSSILSNTPMNRAFLNSQSLSTSVRPDSTDSFNHSSMSRLKSASSVASVLTTPIKTPVKIADLALRLQRLKLQSTLSSNSPATEILKENSLSSKSVAGNVETEEITECQQEKDVRLIDVDIFMPEKEEDTHKKRKNSSTSSGSSSDSVFTEDSRVNKSIFIEAKALAKTFEEMAGRTSTSSSSSDDLLNSRPRWNFDTLPASDDEVLVDNLIELPPSPGKPQTNCDLNTNVELQIIKENKLLDLNTPKKDSEVIKELETEFIEPKVSEKKIMAATLLLDLEKLVNMENNPEAAKLLENLEKVLGVKCGSNSELLATCLQETNDLTKCSKKSDSKLGSNENIKQDSFEKSREDNLDAGSSDSIKELELSKNINLENNFNIDKEININEKSVILGGDKLADISPIIEVSEERSSEKSISDDSIIREKIKDQTAADQKIALDLLTNLGQVLSGNTKDSYTLDLLTNLGRVLNLASNHLSVDMKRSQNKEPLIVNKADKVLLQKKLANRPKLESPKPQSKPNMSKSASRRSLDSSTKNVQKTDEKSMRRSVSGSRTPSSNIVLTTPVSREKSRSLPRDIRKRFSSDPSAEKDIPVKKAVVPEIRKAKVPTVMGTMKTRFRKKSDSEIVVNKKGPMKAVLPLGNMQRRGSLGKKVGPMPGQNTPPKSNSNAPSAFTVTSSTPNPAIALSLPKQSPKTKPVASSTPDIGESKSRKLRLQSTQTSCKRNFSCNISPVTSQMNQNSSNESSSKDSPKPNRYNKTLSPPRGQASKGRQAHNMTVSSIPKYSSLAGFPRRKSTNESLRNQERPKSPKIASVKSQTPKKSPLVQSKSESQIPQSPLKTNNKQSTKLKPFNLISKLRRGSSGNSMADKENIG